MTAATSDPVELTDVTDARRPSDQQPSGNPSSGGDLSSGDPSSDDDARAASGAGAAAEPMSPALFAEIVKKLPKGYALIPVGYELRTAPPVAPGRPVARPGRPAAAKARPGARPAGPWQLPPAAVLWGSAITVIAMMLLVLVSNVLLLGHVKHVRDQQVALDDVRLDLANGTAAVNQTQDGAVLELGRPLGILEIPAIGLREVYLEGTTSKVLQSGPGHRRDTVMPGQAGTSVLFGRKTAFGGPFSQLDQLPLNSVILITNGLGEKLPFRVVDLRRAGDPLPQAPASGSRITLVTATGGAYQPDGALRVDADLLPGPGVNGQQIQVTRGEALRSGLPDAERPLAGDPQAWTAIVAGLLLLMPLTVGVAYARTRWGRWQAWLAGMPPLLAVGVFLTNAVIRLLPNLM